MKVWNTTAVMAQCGTIVIRCGVQLVLGGNGSALQIDLQSLIRRFQEEKVIVSNIHCLTYPELSHLCVSRNGVILISAKIHVPKMGEKHVNTKRFLRCHKHGL